MEKIIWEGKKSLVPQGAAPKFGDAPMEFTVQRPQDAPWTEDTWFCVTNRVNQYSDARISVHFDTADGRRVSINYEQIPNVWVNFRVRLDEIWSKRFFLAPFPGSYKVHCVGKPTDPKEIVSVTFAVKPGVDFKDALIEKVFVSDTQPKGVKPDAPIIDEMGQLIGYEWETKTHSFEEMKERLEKEYERAKEAVAPMPGRSRFGGFTAKKFEATGYFRTHHDGKRWWLVDPDGCAFFSHGLCYGTRMGEFGWYTGMEDFYTWVPSPEDPLFRGAFTHPNVIAEYVKRHGETERSNDWMYNPARGNMMRVFGENWWEAWRAITSRRFHDWGMNTTGVGIVNFIDERLEDFLRISKLPYAVTLKRFPVTEHFIFRDFPDVFADEYAKNSETFANNELKPMAEDPYLLGYFMHNEPEWMFQADVNIAWELLVKNEPLKSRAHMMNWLKERYATAEELSKAWGVDICCFERLLEPMPRTTVLSKQGMDDLAEYEQLLIDAFGKIPLAACRKVAPHHLCLGLRYATVNDKILQSCKAFDVFSFNCYSRVPEEKIEQARASGKPMLVGEWHFGAPDNGLLRTALLSAKTQEERGKAYKRYIETVAGDPDMVGAHYFEYNNQTLMGRFDGEHMAHGLIDCTNLPYPHMVKAITESSERIYGLMTGELEPYNEPIEYLDPSW